MLLTVSKRKGRRKYAGQEESQVFAFYVDGFKSPFLANTSQEGWALLRKALLVESDSTT